MNGRDRLQKLYASEKCRWAIAALFALCLILLASLGTITYYDNDDLNIAWALAGYRSGAPSFSHPFINCITAWLVSGLYTLFPRLPWWLLVQLFSMFVGMTAVGAALFKVGFRHGVSPVVPLLMDGLLLLGLFFYPVSLVMFTVSSAILGCGAVALVLSGSHGDGPGLRRFYWIASLLLMIGSFLIRQSSGICLMCFYFAAMGYRAVSAGMEKNRPALRHALFIGAIGAGCFALLTMANGWGREHQHPPAFLPFEEARARYMDYPRDGYGENPALYEAQGWDDTLYELTNGWFYMDPRINAETLSAISDGSLVNQSTPLQRLAGGVKEFGNILSRFPIMRYVLGISAGSLLLLLVCWLGNKRAFLAGLCGLCMFLGAWLLTLFLLYQGRMNLRTLMTVFYPAVVAILLCVLSLLSGRPRLWAALAGSVIGLAMLLCGYRIFRTVLSYDSADMLSVSNGVVEYALEHPGNVYIRDVYAGNNVDALTVYPEKKPTNLLDWGGCDMYTAARTAQLERNGLDSPYADVFLQKNVYYIGEEQGRWFALLDDYLGNEMGAAGYDIVDRLPGGIAVVKFLP